MHPHIGKTLIGGFVGTLVMTVMMYVTAPMMGLNMDIAAMLGGMLGIGWAGGMLMHFVNGTVIFPLIYAFALYSRLPGSSIARGTAWGVILWLIAQVMVMPMAGAGLFSAAMGGMMAAGGSLVGHVIYGALLGVIAGEAVATGVAAPSSSHA
ncbi:MAG: hypothetical protein HYU37_05085 [Acidobacteria bacterium]|nr:hypothetical protein [Acidobacteriota bacterium]